MPRLLRGLALTLLLGATAACGHFFRRGPSDQAPVTVVFTNEAIDQADVYAVPSSGQAFRIGTVAPGRTETLSIPAGFVPAGDRVNIVARLLARSLAPRSGPVAVRPGDRISVTLPVSENLLSVLPAREP